MQLSQKVTRTDEFVHPQCCLFIIGRVVEQLAREALELQRENTIEEALPKELEATTPKFHRMTLQRIPFPMGLVEGGKEAPGTSFVVEVCDLRSGGHPPGLLPQRGIEAAWSGHHVGLSTIQHRLGLLPAGHRPIRLVRDTFAHQQHQYLSPT